MLIHLHLATSAAAATAQLMADGVHTLPLLCVLQLVLGMIINLLRKSDAYLDYRQLTITAVTSHQLQTISRHTHNRTGHASGSIHSSAGL
jgi:hypothetical protein